MSTSLPELTAVYESVTKLMVTLTPEETYEVIVQEAQKLARALYGSIFLEENGKLVRVYSSVPDVLQINPRPNGYTQQAYAAKRPMIVPIEKIKKAHLEFNDRKNRKMIFIPLTYQDVSIGIITLGSADVGKYSSKKMKLLQLFGSLASLKIRNNILFNEVQEALKTRDLFISMASHELKTPLTTISAYAQLIEKNVKEEKTLKIEWVSNLKNAASRMTRMINELLHVNQIRSGKMVYEFEMIDVVELVRLAVNDFKMNHENHTLTVNTDLNSPKMLADKDKILQVLTNVLNNAAKFTNEEKNIKLDVVQGKRTVTFKITDFGKGIPEDDLKNIFNEFYKAKNSSPDGMGLGLFISKKIIEAHKGKIEIASQLNQGTSVTVTLPVFFDG